MLLQNEKTTTSAARRPVCGRKKLRLTGAGIHSCLVSCAAAPPSLLSLAPAEPAAVPALGTLRRRPSVRQQMPATLVKLLALGERRHVSTHLAVRGVESHDQQSHV